MTTIHQLEAKYNHRFAFTPYRMLGARGYRIIDRKKKTSRVIISANPETIIDDIERELKFTIETEGLRTYAIR